MSANSYVANRYSQTQLVHQRLTLNLGRAADKYVDQVNKTAKPSRIDIGDVVMVTDFGQRSDTPKLDAKFVGPYRVLDRLTGHKYRLRHLDTGQVRDEHGDNLKVILFSSEPESDDFLLSPSVDQPSLVPSSPSPTPTTSTVSHSYNLRYRS